MRTLVTGGAGFIGSNIVDALLARGDDVTVIDNLSTGKRENLDGALANGAELVELDITDAAALLAAVEQAKPEVIFHLAAQIDVRKSVDDTPNDAQINVVGTINVLERRARPSARAWSTPRPAAPSTARARSCRRPRSTPPRRRRPTGCRSSRPRATATSTTASTASRPCRCATATSSARARTRSARPA